MSLFRWVIAVSAGGGAFLYDAFFFATGYLPPGVRSPMTLPTDKQLGDSEND